MSPSTEHITIVMPLFPGVTHLDFTGPQQFFARIPNATTIVASLDGENIDADGLQFANLTQLDTIDQCDLLCVPGGGGVTEVIHDQAFLEHIQRLGSKARYLSSVCTGSIILAAAGLLAGKRAACHWAWRDLLAQFPGVTVSPDRVVRDGNIFTGGGVTAGIDMAITIIAELFGEHLARSIQLGLEYDPKPPFQGGRPDTSPQDIVAGVSANLDKALSEKRGRLNQFLLHRNG